MQPEVRFRRDDAASPRPLSELLACPPDTGSLLSTSMQSVPFQAGQVVFAEGSSCRGLYVVMAGQLARRSHRTERLVTLGTARPGDLVELAAALGERRHTYSLVGQLPGSLLLLPIAALDKAFHTFPPMRMHLLEELAREVSRGYHTWVVTFTTQKRRLPAKPASSPR
ncbi:MAG: Crp/Fnr family transcriptional regulator [Acidobacteriota bacterium]